MKLRQFFNNLNLFFKFFNISDDLKQAFLSLVYEHLSQSEKNRYYTDIEIIKELHKLNIKLIDFYELQIQLKEKKEKD